MEIKAPLDELMFKVVFLCARYNSLSIIRPEFLIKNSDYFHVANGTAFSG